jgi:hypothetical protein
MAFFDTYQTLCVATETMGITKEGEKGSRADEEKNSSIPCWLSKVRQKTFEL